MFDSDTNEDLIYGTEHKQTNKHSGVEKVNWAPCAISPGRCWWSEPRRAALSPPSSSLWSRPWTRCPPPRPWIAGWPPPLFFLWSHHTWCSTANSEKLESELVWCDSLISRTMPSRLCWLFLFTPIKIIRILISHLNITDIYHQEVKEILYLSISITLLYSFLGGRG